ncbi:MAG: hypothetical protein GY749_34215 [Desulfobacteraceae bacterium]|nr:hypothetical protein [Desulfobacteraceae bacterium]
MSHQEKINEIRQTFSPKIKFEDIQKIAVKTSDIESDAFYELTEKLTSGHKPSFKDDYESKWAYFYLPIERDGELICTAVSIFLSYKKIYYVTFKDFSRYGGAGVDKGTSELPKDYALTFDEISRFVPFVKEFGNDLLEELYPYEWRQGRMKRKYLYYVSNLISKEQGDKILEAYKKHLEKNLSVSEISLNDYLKTAEICYRAAFQKDIKMFLRQMEATEFSAEDLHKRWADSRHGGMLFIEDRDSKKEYMDWYVSRKWEGAHPFEIVYSGNIHGISLDPPDEEEQYYRFSVIDPFYNDDFLKMVEALIENNVPFKTYNLENIVKYCMGEAHIGVNTVSMRDETFSYKHEKEEKEQCFSHIEWDKIEILEI